MENGRFISIEKVPLNTDDGGRGDLEVPAGIYPGTNRDVVDELHGTGSAPPPFERIVVGFRHFRKWNRARRCSEGRRRHIRVNSIVPRADSQTDIRARP